MSILNNLPLVHVADLVQNRQNQEVANRMNSFTKLPFMDGRLIENVTVNTTATRIEHKLGRPWKGWIICRKRGSGDVYEASAQNSPSLFITLQSSAQAQIDLWVF